MKYKAGETARVRKDLEVKFYGFLPTNNEMLEHKGEKVTIELVDEDSYRLCGKKYRWTDEMLEPYTFTKADLMTGDVVEHEDGSMKIVLLNTAIGDKTANNIEWGDFESYNDDLTNKVTRERTIVKVRRPEYGYQLTFTNWNEMPVIWEREKPIIELTIEDIAKLKGVSVDQIRIKE